MHVWGNFICRSIFVVLQYSQLESPSTSKPYSKRSVPFTCQHSLRTSIDAEDYTTENEDIRWIETNETAYMGLISSQKSFETRNDKEDNMIESQ